MKFVIFAVFILSTLVLFAQPATDINGVILKLRFANGKNAAEIVRDIRVGYKNHDIEMPELSEDGNILLKNCPEDAESIRVFIEYGSEILKDFLLKNVILNDGNGGKIAEVILPDVQECSIIFFNDKKSIINPGKLRGTVTYNSYSIDIVSAFLGFQNDTPERMLTNLYIPLFDTDNHGTLIFSKIPSQKYDIKFYSNNSASLPVIIDGNKQIKSIFEAHFDNCIRDVNVKTLKSEKDYYVSYSWNGVISHLKVISDENRVLHLKNIPPVKVIIWDNSDEVYLLDINNYLAKLYPQTTMSQFYISTPFLENKAFKCELLCKNIIAPESISSDSISDNQIPGFNVSGISGNKYSIYAVIDSGVENYRLLNTMYIPFFEDTEYANLSILPVIQRKIKLTLKSNSNYIIKTQLPVKLKLKYQDITDDLITGLNDDIVYPDRYNNGEYIFTILQNRKYQLNIDTFSDTYKIPDCFTIDTVNDSYTISLPEPMLKLPAGTDFQYVTHERPGKINNVIAADFSNPMPFYGDKSKILRYWYKKSGCELVVYDNKQVSVRKLLNINKKILSDGNKCKMMPTLYSGWVNNVNRQNILRIWQGKYYVEDKKSQWIHDTKGRLIKIPGINMNEYNIIYNESSDEETMILRISPYQNEVVINRNKISKLSLPAGIENITAYYPGTGLSKCKIINNDIFIGTTEEKYPLIINIPSKMSCVVILKKIDNSNIKYTEDLQTDKKIIYGIPSGRYKLQVIDFASALSYEKEVNIFDKTNEVNILRTDFMLRYNIIPADDSSENKKNDNEENYVNIAEYGQTENTSHASIYKKSSGGLSIIIRDKALWHDRENIRIIINGTGKNKDIHLDFDKLDWVISADAGYMSIDFNYFSPGLWDVTLLSNQLPKKSSAKVGEYGGYALFN